MSSTESQHLWSTFKLTTKFWTRVFLTLAWLACSQTLYFLLISPSSARDKKIIFLSRVARSLRPRARLALEHADVFQKNEKKNKTTSVYRLLLAWLMFYVPSGKKQVDIDFLFYYSCSLGKIEGREDITCLEHRARDGSQNEALIKVLQTIFPSFRDIVEINWRKVIVIFMSV